MSSWTRGLDPKSKTAADRQTFTDNPGTGSFQRVVSPGPSGEGKKKKGLDTLARPKLVSPVRQLLDQTREKEKRADGPDVVEVSLNVASTSSGGKSGGVKKKRKKGPTKAAAAAATTRKTTVSPAIKRLRRKRNAQSKSKLGTGKKPGRPKK